MGFYSVIIDSPPFVRSVRDHLREAEESYRRKGQHDKARNCQQIDGQIADIYASSGRV